MNATRRLIRFERPGLRRRPALAAVAVLLVAGGLVSAPLATPAHAAGIPITIDGSQTGSIFDGVGALSAGANSRLLYDYPEPQRSQILDYLFKPGVGASLQILKVEVGGDTNSTDGAEPSGAHTRPTVTPLTGSNATSSNGYEWWLMQQAKARNPQIQFSALAWGVPGWVGAHDANNPNQGQPYFWSTDMINYYVSWLQHAQSLGLTVESVGAWNERGFYTSTVAHVNEMKTWYESLRTALNDNNLSGTQIIADDGDHGGQWTVADSMAPTIADDRSSAITYTPAGDWIQQSNAGMYDGTQTYTATNGDSATFTFTGTGVDYMTAEDSSRGTVDVSIDAGTATSYNCYSATTKNFQVCARITGLTAGSHTIKITKTGGTYLTIDAFRVSTASPTSIGYDSTFADSVGIIGQHYTCGYGDAMSSCSSSANALAALASGKKLWASESGSEDVNAGAAVARAISHGYLDSHSTAYINWPVIASIYPNLPFANDGLMVANQPWSGAYQLGSSLWATAQTTQVTAPGWHYIDSASGYLAGGTNHSNGSYVTLAAPDNSNYSTIYETLDATTAQTVTVNAKNFPAGVATGSVNVWASDFTTGTYFAQQSSITPDSSGNYTITLQPGHIYSLSTMGGEGHGTATGNVPAVLSLPYSDNFDGYAVGSEARYLADMQGSFEVVACRSGHTGNCVQQMAPTTPLLWNTASEPYALLGDGAWTDYKLSTDVNFNQAGNAELIVRAGEPAQTGNPGKLDGYYLIVGSDGSWSIKRNTYDGGYAVLTSGLMATPPGTGSWHTLALSAQGSTLTATTDGTTLGAVTDTGRVLSRGQVGIGTGGYQDVQFDNLSITPLSAGADYGQNCFYTLTDPRSGKVLEVPGGGTTNGTYANEWASTGDSWQQWGVLADGSGNVKVVNRNSGKLLEDPGHSTTDGQQLDQWSDTGALWEQWQAHLNADGSIGLSNASSGLFAGISSTTTTTDGAPAAVQMSATSADSHTWTLRPVVDSGCTFQIVNRASGLVLEAPGHSTTAGQNLDQWTYVSVPWQQWRPVPVGSSGTVEFHNVNSGLVLDDAGASLTAGSLLDQYTDIGAANQQWQAVLNGDGSYTIKNVKSGLVMSVTGTGAGASVVQNNPNGNYSEWNLLPVVQ